MSVPVCLSLQLQFGYRIQQRAAQWQREAGLLPPEPEVLTYLTLKAEPVPEPALMSTVHGDPEAFMTLNLSRNLDQGMNPAYQMRDGFQTQSCMKADFVWDQEEVNSHLVHQALRSMHNHTLGQLHPLGLAAPVTHVYSCVTKQCA